MYKHHEGFFLNENNQRLFCQYWENPRAKGTVVITHGQGEHSGSYERFVQAFKGDELSFIAWDYQGHGRSDGLRGHAPKFESYIQDFKSFHKELLNSNWLKGPVIYFSHSMGALIQLLAFSENTEFQIPPAQALVFASPLWGLSLPVPQYKQQGALVISQLLPEVTLGNEIKNSQLTRDPEIIREFESDPFRHQKISAAVYLGFLDQFEGLKSRAQVINLNSLVLCSDNDPVVSSTSAKEIASFLPGANFSIENSSVAGSGNFLQYPGAKHELFNDIMREQVYSDLRLFFKSALK